MAKKNANKRSKTATEKTKQSAEPKSQILAKWSGMNIAHLAPMWLPTEDYDTDLNNTTDEEMKQWLIQDNAYCCDNQSVETRNDTVLVGETPPGIDFVGPVWLQGDVFYVADSSGGILRKRLGEAVWQPLAVHKRDAGEHTVFSEFHVHDGRFIALSEEGTMYTGAMNPFGICDAVFSARHVPDSLLSASSISVTPHGLTAGGCPTAVGFSYSLSNRYGNTRGSRWSEGVVYDLSPVEYTHEKYLTINIALPDGYTTGQDTSAECYDITGVDIYCHLDDAQDAIFIGHVNVPVGASSVSFDWLGALNNLQSWPMVPLTIPMENMTSGPNGRFAASIDDKLYVWGGYAQPYRVWYGGNPGNEIQFNRGTGGGWMDADPQQFTQIWDIHEYKTYNATIPTALGDQPNTGRSPRFNVVDHNMQITNEVQAKGAFLEKVDNVSGTKNRNASVAFYDGLYTINRFGVALTTMQQSSSIMDKQDFISENIKPVFHEYPANHLNKSKMVAVNGHLYMALGVDEDGHLDNIIFCYNIALKSWFTFSVPEIEGKLKNLFVVDSVDHVEGLGIVTERGVYYIKQFGEHKPNFAPVFPVNLETGQISAKLPLQDTVWLEQIELRFDYIVGDLDVYVNYEDYWGRPHKVTKHIRVPETKRNWSEWIRFGTLVESYNIQIVGKARFRLTHFMCNVYRQSGRIGIVYGRDAHASRRKIHGGARRDIHHYIDSYNNLRDAIAP